MENKIVQRQKLKELRRQSVGRTIYVYTETTKKEEDRGCAGNSGHKPAAKITKD